MKIGFTMPRTGYLATAYSVAVQAYELWRQRVNARGGLVIANGEK